MENSAFPVFFGRGSHMSVGHLLQTESPSKMEIIRAVDRAIATKPADEPIVRFFTSGGAVRDIAIATNPFGPGIARQLRSWDYFEYGIALQIDETVKASRQVRAPRAEILSEVIDDLRRLQKEIESAIEALSQEAHE